MRSLRTSLKLVIGCIVMQALAGCESDGSSSTPATDYYGAGVYDPWYRGNYDYSNDIEPPPPIQPGVLPPRPTHPIALPPPPRPAPMPSIPTRPRVGFTR